ncbi:hypothetical protein, partial [Burkholderia ubonensis]|uniref:hypothetical protein n=1 Tax=Burkholderia ubonensis TaxID=101571 RepID=UPI001E30F679
SPCVPQTRLLLDLLEHLAAHSAAFMNLKENYEALASGSGALRSLLTPGVRIVAVLLSFPKVLSLP